MKLNKRPLTAAVFAAITLSNNVTVQASPVGDEFQVNSFTGLTQDLPSIAMDADGDFVIVWVSADIDGDGDGSGVSAQRFDAGGNAIGVEFQVNTYTTDNQRAPSVAMDADGDFVVAWHSLGQDGDFYGIYAQRFDNNGVAQGGEISVSTFTTGQQRNPSVAMDEDGEFTIAWKSFGQDGNGYGVFAALYKSSGNIGAPEFQVNSFTSFSQSDPAVAWDPDGGFVITWWTSTLIQDGSGYGVFAQRYSPVATPVGTEFQVNSYSTGNQNMPSVAMNVNGDFVISWQSNGQDGDAYGIYAQRFDVNGNAIGSEIDVSTYTTADQQRPKVAMDEHGDFVVTWKSDGQDGSDNGVFVQRLAADGTKLGNEFQANTYTTGSQSDAVIGMDSDGDFVVSWESVGQVAGWDVFAQRYNSAGRFDMDGGAQSDLLWRQDADGRNIIWLMDSADRTALGLPVVSNMAWQVKGFGDTDGDGRSDILWRNMTDGRNQIWKMIDGGKQTGSIATISDLNWELVGSDDFDGNGTDDILWRHTVDGRNTIYFMDGFNATSTNITSISNLDWQVAGTGDIDGDDKADIFWRNQSTGQNTVWLMDGANNNSNNLTSIPDINWTVQGIGDLNKDGLDDIVWRDSVTRAVVAWLMQPGLIEDQQNISASSGANFQVELVGDLSGDGEADIVWRDQVNGTNLLWEMDGVIKTPSSIQKVGDINWKIMP